MDHVAPIRWECCTPTVLVISESGLGVLGPVEILGAREEERELVERMCSPAHVRRVERCGGDWGLT